MRPKKIILCVDDNEQDLSVMSFMLSTNGYRVIAATDAEQAVSAFSEAAIDLVLADYSLPRVNGSQLIGRLKTIAGHVPMILLGDAQMSSGEMHAADLLLTKKACSPHELLERVKIMSARKRGPRKGAVRHAPAIQPATELAVAS